MMTVYVVKQPFLVEVYLKQTGKPSRWNDVGPGLVSLGKHDGPEIQPPRMQRLQMPQLRIAPVTPVHDRSDSGQLFRLFTGNYT